MIWNFKGKEGLGILEFLKARGGGGGESLDKKVAL